MAPLDRPTGYDAGQPDAGRTAPGDVPVWDLPTRLFHWTLVVLLAVAYFSAQAGNFDVHFPVGYAILTLILFRIAWGFVGSRTARFADFVKGPPAVALYLRGLVSGGAKEPGTLGHNPAGALMVLALLAAVLVQAVTGLFTTDDILVEGPLYHLVPSSVASDLSTVHRIVINLILLLVAVHVLAVAAYKLIKREDLVRPMITGRKRVAGLTVPEPQQAGLLRALVVLALAAAAVTALVQFA